MKKFSILFLLLAFSLSSLQAQKKVRESDLKGQWKMVFDFDEEDIEEGVEDNFWLGSIISGPMSEFVMDIIKEIDIEMEFLNDGKLKITVDAFDDHEVEYEDWYINSDGELVMGNDDDDDVWLLDGKKLYQYEKKSGGRLEKQEIYLVRR